MIIWLLIHQPRVLGNVGEKEKLLLQWGSACAPLSATRAVGFPMWGNEQRQTTVVCTATVEARGIFPVNSRSRFDVLPTTRALKCVPLLFLSGPGAHKFLSDKTNP